MEIQKHSGLGIASFVCSIASAILSFVVFGIAGVLQASSPSGIDEKSPQAVIIGLSAFALIFVSLVALGLGIASFFQRDRKKVYGILGTVFAIGICLCMAAVTIIGLSVKKRTAMTPNDQLQRPAARAAEPRR
jgi:MFS family permease